jgi:hypothetical protein
MAEARDKQIAFGRNEIFKAELCKLFVKDIIGKENTTNIN